jgi:apolipoprotein D and lipocalin family protein
MGSPRTVGTAPGASPLTERGRTVLVGEPGRDYLWILAREKSVPPDTYGRLVQRAGALGFDTARLVVPQR